LAVSLFIYKIVISELWAFPRSHCLSGGYGSTYAYGVHDIYKVRYYNASCCIL